MTGRQSYSISNWEDLFHGVFNNHDAIMLLIEPQSGRIMNANRAAEKFYGYDTARFKEIRITDINLGELDESAQARESASGDVRNQLTCSHKLASGEIRIVETHPSPVQIDGQSFLFIIIHDVTAYKKAEEERRRAAEQYSSLFDRMMDGIYRSTHAGKFVDVNPAMIKMFGFSSKEEMLGVDIKKELYFEPEERGSHILDTGQEETEVYRMRRKDGTEIWVEDHGWYVHDEQGNIIYHEGLLRDVTERKRAQWLWSKYTAQIQVLYRVSRELNASFDKQRIYEVTCEGIRQVVACDIIYISAFEPHTNMIALAYGWHDNNMVDISAYPPIPLEPAGKGTQSEVIRTAMPLLVNDFQARLKNTETVYVFDNNDQRVEQLPEEGDIPRSALVVPMIVEHQVIGAIQVFSYQANAYTEGDLNVLNTFASQTAVVLKNCDLLQRVQQENRERKQAENSLRARTRELETLFSIANHISFVQNETEILPQILQELKRAIDADTIAIILVEPNQKRLNLTAASGDLAPDVGHTFNVDEGISGIILKSRQLYQTDDLSSDPQRLRNLAGVNDLGPAIFIPLLSGDHPLGVLLVARKKSKETRSFTLEATRLIITASELLGNAINRVRLHADTMRQLNHLKALREVDQAIATTFDLRITLNTLLRHAIGQLHVDAASVLLLDSRQRVLRCAAAQGFNTEHIWHTDIPLASDFAGRCAKEGKRIEIFDPAQVSSDPPLAHLWAKEGFVNYVCVHLLAKWGIKGVLEVYRRTPFIPNEDWYAFLEMLAGQAAISIDNAQMFENLQSANKELVEAYDATIEGWSRALDLRDEETEGHTQRVTDLTVRLAKTMGIKDSELIHIRRGALLHDIGKMGIPDHILLKPGKLTPEEWDIMRQHPTFALKMLEPIAYLKPALDIPYLHHERWNGKGYPHGLTGAEIPLTARIFAVVDVYDALTSARPYREAWAKEKTLAYLKECSGTEFDPDIVDIFLKMI